MQWQILAGPLVGALIGYITNKIAVEMLFRPLKPIYIGKFRLPFTPGLIPKGKDRLGKAIGDAVGKDLLTPAVIEETLLSENMAHHISEQLDLLFTNLSTDQTTLESKLQQGFGDTRVTRFENQIKQTLTQKVSSGLITMNLGELVADEVLITVQEKVKGTLLAMMVTPSFLAPIVEEIKNHVNLYLEEHAEEKVEGFIDGEMTNVLTQPLSSFFKTCDSNELKLIVLDFYRSFVNKYAAQLLETLNLSKIVEEKVCAMEIRDVEKLVLSIMEKELGAVVNLGALIGFILGLLNVLF